MLKWWLSRLPLYNIGIVCSGIMAYMFWVLLGTLFLPIEAGFEITLITILLHGIAFLGYIFVANVLYCLGPLAEVIISPRKPNGFRYAVFGLGFSIAVLGPFVVPIHLLVFEIILGRV